MEEAAVYRKELIKPGLDADTQTPAGMRHGPVGSEKFSFNLKPPLLLMRTWRLQADDGADAITGTPPQQLLFTTKP